MTNGQPDLETVPVPAGGGVRFNDPKSIAGAPYLVVSLHTPSYRAKADRLLASCRRFSLPAVVYELPDIHHSISLKGAPDLAYTKSAVIRLALKTFGKPVFYVDADMVFVEHPTPVRSLIPNFDFGIYNWFADAQADAWRPIEIPRPGAPVSGKRYWCFRYALDLWDPAQLFASGASQFWNATAASAALLDDWQNALAEFPTVADDECLDFAFNNRDNTGLRAAWFDKSYARYPWWPHVKPVVDHPDEITGESGRISLTSPDHRMRYYPERATPLTPHPACFPRGAILDLRDKVLLRAAEDQLLIVGRLKNRFWV